MCFKKIISTVLCVVLVFGLLPNAALAVETDTSGPVLTVVSCDKQNETLYEGDSITLVFSAEDPSGIGSNKGMLMTYRDPNGENYREFLGPACKLNTSTGFYECTFTVKASDKVGRYTFAKLHAYDAVGNYSFIRPACSFVVAGTETDTEGPVITEISCDKENETLYEGDSITYTFKLEDPSGIGSPTSMLMTYRNPDGDGYTEFGGPACVYDSETGFYKCVFTVSANHKIGTYEFAKLSAYDAKGNSSFIRPDKYFTIAVKEVPGDEPNDDNPNNDENLDGVWEGYIPVSTKQELYNVRNNLSGKYYLTNDIIFSPEDFISGGAYYTSGRGWSPIGFTEDEAFTGVFDGNGYKIVGLQIKRYKATAYAGLFGWCNGTVKNLGIEDSVITFDARSSYEYVYAGSIAGYAGEGSIISNCWSSSTVTANTTEEYDYSRAYAGGIVGVIEDTAF